MKSLATPVQNVVFSTSGKSWRCFVAKRFVMDLVLEGHHVILRREHLMKLHQVWKGRPIWFGKRVMTLDGVVGHAFGSLFELKDKSLVPAARLSADLHMKPADEYSVKDNRFLHDDGKSQKLSREDIELLKDRGHSGKEIIEHLVENSATFMEKTDYSKEKYLKKKGSKYLSRIEVCKPTTRLLCEMYAAHGPTKTLNMRIDSLAQMLTACNVRCGCSYLVFENCLGLVVGAVLERLAGRGHMIQLYSGDPPTRQTIDAYNMCEEDKRNLFSLNIEFLLKVNDFKHDVMDPAAGLESEVKCDKDMRRQQQKWESHSAITLLQKREMDGLIIASRFHPADIVLHLMQYLASSRPIVIYSPYQEPLARCYKVLKDSERVVSLRLTETWLRKYQVLENRTHPDVSMSGAGGYVLSGIYVDDTKSSVI